MHLSMHNWMRAAPLEVTVRRLAKYGYKSIEIGGEPEVYNTSEVRGLLREHNLRCWGSISLMFTGLDLSSAPDLEGYVKPKGKDNAERLIAASDGAPILASWHYGLGRTAAFTSDVKNRWAVNWLEWEGYGKFWTQVVRESMRRDDEPGPTLEVTRVVN